MNVIRHDHIATYCDVEGLLGALGKKNERSVDLILCRSCVQNVTKYRGFVANTRPRAWWPSSEITLHRKSYSTLIKL